MSPEFNPHKAALSALADIAPTLQPQHTSEEHWPSFAHVSPLKALLGGAAGMFAVLSGVPLAQAAAANSRARDQAVLLAEAVDAVCDAQVVNIVIGQMHHKKPNLATSRHVLAGALEDGRSVHYHFEAAAAEDEAAGFENEMHDLARRPVIARDLGKMLSERPISSSQDSARSAFENTIGHENLSVSLLNFIYPWRWGWRFAETPVNVYETGMAHALMRASGHDGLAIPWLGNHPPIRGFPPPEGDAVSMDGFSKALQAGPSVFIAPTSSIHGIAHEAGVSPQRSRAAFLDYYVGTQGMVVAELPWPKGGENVTMMAPRSMLATLQAFAAQHDRVALYSNASAPQETDARVDCPAS